MEGFGHGAGLPVVPTPYSVGGGYSTGGVPAPFYGAHGYTPYPPPPEGSWVQSCALDKRTLKLCSGTPLATPSGGPGTYAGSSDGNRERRDCSPVACVLTRWYVTDLQKSRTVCWQLKWLLKYLPQMSAGYPRIEYPLPTQAC
ncbi:hypothetical protein CYMTET_31079 [Cymbomonas tetramitiformis]|uniref:Uncharacterized protein n=1 Tax=Cymbomonas tetramitiformis TaxID=36881 RepID=A0AAE0FHH8_9CHLO|nr:hypothetical protein CYMTET_31079 [Cymbomonas tetramitiformis]